MMDKGAHFTYNIGVWLMRAGVLTVAAAAALFLFSILFGSYFTMHRESTVEAVVSNSNIEFSSEQNILNKDKYFITYSGSDENGSEIEMTVRVTLYMYEDLTYDARKNTPHTYYLYKVKLNKGGTDWYISPDDKYAAERQYEYCYNISRYSMPVGMWVLLFLAAAIFYLGHKQMELGMKYPRNDVPEEFAGMPAVLHNDDYFKDRAASAVRADMKDAMMPALPCSDPKENVAGQQMS